jgi:hypothetical protein
MSLPFFIVPPGLAAPGGMSAGVYAMLTFGVWRRRAVRALTSTPLEELLRAGDERWFANRSRTRRLYHLSGRLPPEVQAICSSGSGLLRVRDAVMAQRQHVCGPSGLAPRCRS